jgi:hypothetical protein
MYVRNIWCIDDLLLLSSLKLTYCHDPVTKLNEDKNLGYIDHNAVSFNSTLDLCKLVGLILFCSGGIIFAMSLLFPSFLTNYCDDDVTEDSIHHSKYTLLAILVGIVVS